jgi:hypothetical protein
MADDKYDDDYWAMAEFWWQALRDQTIGLPRVPGGREFRPVAGGTSSENIEDRRVTGEPSDLKFDANWEDANTKIINTVFRNMLRNVEPWPLGDPGSFQGQDTLSPLRDDPLRYPSIR